MKAISIYDVFISYRHNTGFYMAELIYTKLTAAGYTVFMDKTMRSGQYEEKIRTAISNSKNYIVVLFPDDIESLCDPQSWLNKEAAWASENGNATIIPVMCDGFEWSKDDSGLTEAMVNVKRNNGIVTHKDNSFDRIFENLCDNYLQNVTPSKPKVSTVDFFKYNLESRTDAKVTRVDVAFHAGAPWIMSGEKNEILVKSLGKGVKWRVIVNRPDVAEGIGKFMRNDAVLYIPFSQVNSQWKRMSERYPDLLEVRECPIPLIHVYHSVHFEAEDKGKFLDEAHVRYYAYNNARLDNAFEHKIHASSKYYSIYNEEFEYLWELSEKI